MPRVLSLVISLLLKLVRNAIGGILVLLDLITRGAKLKRSEAQQAKIAKETETLALYQFFACPFCIKTRRRVYKLNLPIVKRSVSKGSNHRRELLEGGGKVQSPCLRIEDESGVRWLYESSAIIKYLETRFVQ